MPVELHQRAIAVIEKLKDAHSEIAKEASDVISALVSALNSAQLQPRAADTYEKERRQISSGFPTPFEFKSGVHIATLLDLVSELAKLVLQQYGSQTQASVTETARLLSNLQAERDV